MDSITITGLSLHGFHGVYPQERRDGQLFLIDLTLDVDFSRAAETDDVSHTVDYSVVVDLVAGIVQGEPVNLVETLAERIARAVLALPLVHHVSVTVHKPHAPLGHPVSDVQVQISRSRGSAE